MLRFRVSCALCCDYEAVDTSIYRESIRKLILHQNKNKNKKKQEQEQEQELQELRCVPLDSKLFAW